jgi:hypothetical protein
MVRWPALDRMSKVSAPIVERFKKTAEAKDLEQDAREWVMAGWPWMPDAPFLFVARASDAEERHYVIDETGALTMRVSRPTAPRAA